MGFLYTCGLMRLLCSNRIVCKARFVECLVDVIVNFELLTIFDFREDYSL